MPTTILFHAIRRRGGLTWGVPAMLLAAPYLLLASTCDGLLGSGGPGWLNLLVLLGIWNALKFLAMGPVSVVARVRARWQEASARRRDQDLMGGRNVDAQPPRVAPIPVEATRNIR